MAERSGGRSTAALLVSSLPRAPSSARRARRAVCAVLQDRLAAEALDTVLLLTTELVSNATSYAAAPIELTVALSAEGTVRVEVADASARAPEPLDVPADAENGRGLLLVGALADAWGTEPTPPQGKVVWFALRTRQPVSTSPR